MKTVKVKEMPNGALLLSSDGKEIDILEEITKTEFENRFPEISTYNIHWADATFLENGLICLNSEWNGEVFHTNGKIVRMVYEQLGEDDFQTIGYIVEI